MKSNEDQNLTQFLVFKVLYPSMELLKHSVITVNLIGSAGEFGTGMSGIAINEAEKSVLFFFSPPSHDAGRCLRDAFDKTEKERNDGIKIVLPNEQDNETIAKILAKGQVEMDGAMAGDVKLN